MFRILVLFPVLWISSGFPKPPTAGELCWRGIFAARDGEVEKAITLLTAALSSKLDPLVEASARNGRGMALRDKGELDKALADFSDAIRLQPDSAIPVFNRGLVYNDKGDFDSAIRDFTKALDLQSDLSDAYHSRAFAYYEKGDFDTAITDYTAAIDLKPDDAGMCFDRGRAWAKKGNHEKALADFHTAIDLDQKAIDDFTRAGNTAENPALTAKETAGRNVAAAFAYNLDAWIFCTCPEESLLDGARALKFARKACELTQWTASGYIDTLAASYAETGDYETAIKYQAWYVTLKPADKEGQLRLDLYKAHKPYRETK